jgi:hypothetical protein
MHDSYWPTWPQMHLWVSARPLRISNRPRINADNQARQRKPIEQCYQPVRDVAKTGSRLTAMEACEQNLVSKTIIGAVLIN